MTKDQMKKTIKGLRQMIDAINAKYDGDLASLRVMAIRHPDLPGVKKLMWVLENRRKDDFTSMMKTLEEMSPQVASSDPILSEPSSSGD